jgi:regulator of cell morphogenesis and NO signaling
VKEWTAHRPQLYRLFAEHGIDVFREGDKTLADVCCEKGLEPRRVAEELAAVVRPMYREAGADWYQATIAELCDHIEATHHDYLRRELPRLGELVAKTEREHRSEHPEIEAVKTIFERIRRHLLEHIETEGTVLFPALRKRETGETLDQEALADPIDLVHRMKEDHDFIEAEFSQIRRLTNGYSAPSPASPAYRSILGGLWELEANLHLNVHEEDDILFSKALLQ